MLTYTLVSDFQPLQLPNTFLLLEPLVYDTFSWLCFSQNHLQTGPSYYPL